MQEKPFPTCAKFYIGNLPYDVEDDDVKVFFKKCGEVIKIRWLTRKDSGEFRGCGFVEFDSSETADKAAKLNGKQLKGRPVKLDWTE